MKKKCESCNGTGQISFFGGESRFLLTHEECPDCFGTGLMQEEETHPLSTPSIKPESKQDKD